jgi:hypothetical protein
MQQQTEQVERRPLTVEELRLLADMLIAEFPELRRRAHGEVLAGWRRLAERHHLVVEHRRRRIINEESSPN